MQKGNIIRFHIDRVKYHLTPSESHYCNILCGTILSLHKDKISVKAMDLWDVARPIKYFTIDKKDVICVL